MSRLEAQRRIVMLGELHGTVEAPAHFGDIVEARASRSRPLTVGVELPPSALAVRCGTASGPGNPYWARPLQDGRTSLAMWRLVCRLQDLQRRHRIALFGFAPEVPAADRSADPYVPSVLARAQAQGPEIYLLVGNAHARRAPNSLTAGLERAGVAVSAVTVSSRSATAWGCRSRDSCGPQRIPMHFCPDPPSLREPTLITAPAPASGAPQEWDGCLDFPVLTPSPPAEPSLRPGAEAVPGR
jgi:hypothetical protein